MLRWTTPDGVRMSSELPVNDWSFPLTPESGGADFTCAQAACGAACPASKEMNTRRNNERFIKFNFIKMSFQSTIWSGLDRREFGDSVIKWRESNELFPAAEIIFRSRCPGSAAATSEVINSFLLFKIRAFESSHANLIVSPSKIALTLMHLRSDISVTQEKSRSYAKPQACTKAFSLMSLQPNDRDCIKCTCSYIDRCQ